MKKISFLSAIFLLAVSLSSCGGGKSESTEDLKKSREGFEKLIARYEVPLYSGSEFVEMGKVDNLDAAIYKTSDSADKVLEFYNNKMTELKLSAVMTSPALPRKVNGKDVSVKFVQGVALGNDPLQIVVSMPGKKGAPEYQMIAFAVGY
ncbi:MAG: hypothetical protein A2X34_03910 [Elusimicrobia bacterium GWC2_51_8]|nr:MAG: hypothetical protein A2X33_08415 [Elusimicrobia bacterium GWA2_51_34]OGR58949.1 MAG: hypothetical protein A2X34_03910 [Elusimicrobia bacterium GWC2_51_8]OGR86262.1 MAG: hypothetical protein A2021_04450 [Elusimicrobia bacterium GWF2_52_66]HAF95264.1 hypothetical protein [Elusimicrobiota bacterium]HCE97342.1 hypothetical protein [Elusimicrobiota bacterium]